MASFMLGVFYYLRLLFFIPYDENLDKKLLKSEGLKQGKDDPFQICNRKNERSNIKLNNY